MVRILLPLLIIISIQTSVAQKITSLILVGSEGITEDINAAHSLIIIKEFPGSGFQRADYKLYGPLVKVRTYKDTAMSVLEGRYLEYHPSGNLRLAGMYSGNLKSDQWFTFNDTGKIVMTQEYLEGQLIKTIDPDTVKKEEMTDDDGREANYKGGQSAWQHYLGWKLTKSEAAEKSVNGGKVIVSFKIDVTGKVTDVFMKKSVEFILDEEAMTVIQKSPKWKPALQNGKPVNAYRNQPLTFVK